MFEFKKELFRESVPGDCTVADARALLQEEHGIPEKARAVLNGQVIGRKKEAETELHIDDELYFEERKHKGLVLLGSLLAALLLTAGIYAVTATTQVTTITVTNGGTEFAAVTANSTDSPSYTITGQQRGVISEGSLFDITVPVSYTGDLVVSVFLNNVDELQNDYSNWVMRLRLANSANASIDTQGSLQVITLDNAMASFEVHSSNVTASNQTVYVHIDGGSYKTFSAGWLTGFNPSIYAQVLQAGSH